MTRLFPDKSLRQDGAIHGAAPPGSHYNPNQPRVPAGHHDGGRWTSAGGGAVGNDPRVMSDAPPDNDWKPGAQYAAGPRPGWVRVRIGERWVEVEAGQAAHLVAAQARAQDAIARVRQLDPSWQPTPSLSASQPRSVEGLIRRYEAEAEQAEGRLGELTRPLTPAGHPEEQAFHHAGAKRYRKRGREMAGQEPRERHRRRLVAARVRGEYRGLSR